MALLEALSYGIPCLVTKGTNMGDEIKQENAGWVADTNSESVKVAFLNLLDHLDFAEKSNNAYKLAEKYSWDSIAALAHDEYQKLVHQV